MTVLQRILISLPLINEIFVGFVAKIENSVKFKPPLDAPLLCSSRTGTANQTAAADIFQTVDACMLTAAPLSCCPPPSTSIAVSHTKAL